MRGRTNTCAQRRFLPGRIACWRLHALLLLACCAASAESASDGPGTKAAGDPPVIDEQPIGRSVTEGGHVAVPVLARGTAPLSYQWRKNNQPLTNSARLTGANGGVLNIDPVLLSDSGDYTVVVTNSGGSITSAVVSVSVGQLTPVLTQMNPTQVLVTVHGQIGDVYRIELSENFGPWQTNGYATNLTGQAEFLHDSRGGGFRQLRGRYDHMLPVLYPPSPQNSPASFRAYGKLNQVWRIEAATNLPQWESLAVVTNLTGWVKFNDTSAPAPAHRFYRIAPP